MGQVKCACAFWVTEMKTCQNRRVVLWQVFYIEEEL